MCATTLLPCHQHLSAHFKHGRLSICTLPRAPSLAACAGKWSASVFRLDGYNDRLVMTQQILPALKAVHPNPKTLLWIGVQPYTLRYPYLMGSQDISVTTLELDEAQAVYGSTQRHIVAPAQDCRKHLEPDSFDVVCVASDCHLPCSGAAMRYCLASSLPAARLVEIALQVVTSASRRDCVNPQQPQKPMLPAWLAPPAPPENAL